MTKLFAVELGYLARVNSAWFDYRVPLTIRPGEQVELFRRAPAVGKPPTRIGSYAYAELGASRFPMGLKEPEAQPGMSRPLVVVRTQAARQPATVPTRSPGVAVDQPLLQEIG